MLQSRAIKRTAYLVITSDRGLAGGYNANVLRKVWTALQENHKSSSSMLFSLSDVKVAITSNAGIFRLIEEATGIPDSPKFSDIKAIAASAVKGFENGTYDELHLVYNQFYNAMTQVPVIKQLLPLDQSQLSGTKSDYEYEPSPEKVLDVLLPKYAETVIYSAVLEGKASEFGARMTAMGNATKNATKMIAGLTLTYNRARQAAITQEIAEIVGGANAQQ